jgi:hypothetical protein
MNDHHAQIDEEPPKKKQVSNINKKADSNIKHLSILVRTDSMTFTCCDKLEAKTPKPQTQPNGMERSNSQVLDLSCSLPQIKTSYDFPLLKRKGTSVPRP